MDGDPTRMHPADLIALQEALGRGMAPSLPNVDAPPVVATGATADLIRSIMRQEIARNADAIAGPDEKSLRRIVREEIDRDREINREACRRMIKEGIDEETKRIFADLEMRIDPDHITETRKKLSGIFDAFRQSQELKSEGFREAIKIIMGWVGAAVAAAFAVFFIGGGKGNGH